MNKYDRVIQENIRTLTLSLIKKIIGIKNARVTILSRKMQRTLEREADLVIKVRFKNGYTVIYNVEWQTSNDRTMSRRMLLQHSILHAKYLLPVIGIVIYTGKEPINMPNEIMHEKMNYAYELIDLSKYDAEEFLRSNVPDEIIIAILAGDPSRETARLQIREILIKLHSLLGNDASELNRRIIQLEILSELKGFQDIIIEEEKNMPIILDNSKSIRFQEGLKQGLEQGLNRGLERATQERNIAFVKYLLLHTNHSIEEIATLVNVPVSFVQQVKAKL